MLLFWLRHPISVALASLVGSLGFIQVAVADERSLSLLHPIERIAFSDDWRSRTRRVLRKGAHTFVILKLPGDSCAAIASSIPGVSYYAAHPINLATPSSEGSRIGIYYETLIPRNRVSCALSPYVLADWRPKEAGKVSFRVDTAEVSVAIAFVGVFEQPARPFLVGLTNSYALAGHCRSYCPLEAELGHKYAALLTAHHIQPMQNWVVRPPIRDGLLDLDHGSESRRSFRDLVMGYAISGLIGFPRARDYRDPVGYLRALEETVRNEGLLGRAWVYVIDEPRDLSALRRELVLYRKYAPSVRTMVTTSFKPELRHLIDIFAPVINSLHRADRPNVRDYAAKALWPYASCMGSCGPSRAGRGPDVRRFPGPDTGLPDFLIDRPAERLFRYFQELAKINAGAGFYYEATEGYRLVRAGVDLFADPWNFGGNGDGLLLYPGRPGEFGLSEHQPLPTIRLKLIRHAIENYW